MIGVVFLQILVVGLAAAAQTPVVPEDTVIRLERTACLGTCPVYSVEIDATGAIRYEGSSHVRVTGLQTARLGRSAVSRLTAMIEQIEFFALQDMYEGGVTDGPTTFVTVTMNGQTKRIRDYLNAPAALTQLEREIDLVARTKRWIFFDDDTLDALVTSGWSAASDEGTQFLLDAVDRDDLPIARRLLDLGTRPIAPPDARLRPRPPALYLARSAAMVQLLLSAGGDPNEPNPHSEFTALMASLYKGADVVTALIAAGARLEEVVEGHTALYLAVCSGNLPVVRVLLAAGANPRGSTNAPAVQCARSARASELALRQRLMPDWLKDRRPLSDFDEVIALLEAADQKR